MISRSNDSSRLAWIVRAIALALFVSGVLSFFTAAARAADDTAAPSAEAGGKPMASEELNSGASLDVMRLDRHGDGLVSLQFRFRNPGNDKIKVMGWDEGRDLPGKIYLIDEAAKSKYTVANVKSSSKKEGEHETLLASRVPQVELQAGQSQDYWAKFSAPAELSKVTLYFPDAPPIENLTISAAPAAASSAGGADAKQASASAGETNGAVGAGAVIASAPHNSGARVEVNQVRRTGDGFVEIRWRYVNPGKEKVRVMGSDEGRDLPKEMYVIDPASKKLYGVVTDTSGAAIASRASQIDLSPDKPVKLWARFPVAASATHVTLYLPQTLPLEDMPIEGGGK
jgi:hypothetical protein